MAESLEAQTSNVFPSLLKLNWNTFKGNDSIFIASLLNEDQLRKKRICYNGGPTLKNSKGRPYNERLSYPGKQ